MERAMDALEPIIVNDYQMWCAHPGCGYKSRKNTDKNVVVRLGMKHQTQKGHAVNLLNHQIKVDIYQPNQPILDVESVLAARLDDPPPF